MKRNLLFFYVNYLLFTNLSVVLFFLCSSMWYPYLSGMKGGCCKSVFQDVDRAGLLANESEDEQDNNNLDEARESSVDTGVELGTTHLKTTLETRLVPLLNAERRAVLAQHLSAKATLEKKLAPLLNEERRAVLAQHLPEQVLLVLDRVQTQHRKLYRKLELPRIPLDPNDSCCPHPDSTGHAVASQRETLECELMGIMLFELCTSLGQENQDLADVCRGQDSWVGCCKWYWAIMGAATLAMMGIACYAPFAPCGAWHG